MAQSKVTEFFGSRKRKTDIQPSKRRKVTRLAETDTIVNEDCFNDASSTDAPRTRRRGSKIVNAPNLNASKVNKGRGQSKTLVAENTASCDDHNASPPGTPTKRNKDGESSTSAIKRTRKSDVKDLMRTPQAFDFRKFVGKNTPTARKKLVMPITDQIEANKNVDKSESVTQSLQPKSALNFSNDEKDITTETEKDLAIMKPELQVEQSKPEETQLEKKEKNTTEAKLISKKLDTATLHAKLSKTNKLADLQEKLSQYNKSVKKVKDARDKFIQKDAECEDIVDTTAKTEKDLKTVIKPELQAEQSRPDEKQVKGKKEKNTTEAKIPSKTLDAAALHAKLSKTNKLADLQEKLAQYSKSVKKVKEAREKLIKEEAECEDIEETKSEIQIQKKTEKVQAATKEKEAKGEKTKTPAYERFHHLVESVKPTLSLPYKYKLLEEMFHGVETVVSMLYKRSETCTFSKLKAAVQKIISRNFEEKNLGQMKTVYPEAYIMKQLKGLPAHGYANVANMYQLIIEPNLHLNKDNSLFDKEGRPEFTASQLLERKAYFHKMLILIVKKYHSEFLSKLDRPLNVADKDLARWHPRFRLDEVPDIEPAELPQSPASHKTFSTAQDVLEEAKGKLNPRIQKALELIASPTKEQVGEKSPKQENLKQDKKNVNKPVSTNVNLKGVSSSLLDRIRAKETRKQEAAMLRSPEEEKRLQMMERLPELARILRCHYLTHKKPAIEMETAVAKMAQSCKSPLGHVETDKHLKLLLELVPDWIQVLKVKNVAYLKLDRNKDMNAVISKIENLRKQAM